LADEDLEAAENEPLVDFAVDVIAGRRGCMPHEALLLLSDAAEEHDMSIIDMARCIVADREIPRRQPDMG